jgi:hypothetical protein
VYGIVFLLRKKMIKLYRNETTTEWFPAETIGEPVS